MSISDKDFAFVTDPISEAGPISIRKMFGGLAIYADGAVFALLKRCVDEFTHCHVHLACALLGGCGRFLYYGRETQARCDGMLSLLGLPASPRP